MKCRYLLGQGGGALLALAAAIALGGCAKRAPAPVGPAGGEAADSMGGDAYGGPSTNDAPDGASSTGVEPVPPEGDPCGY